MGNTFLRLVNFLGIIYMVGTRFIASAFRMADFGHVDVAKNMYSQ